MVCDEIKAGQEHSGSADSTAAVKRTRITGRKKIQRKQSKPLRIDENDSVEYIGITEKNEEYDRPLERLMCLSDEEKEKPAVNDPGRPAPVSEPETVKPEIVAEGFSSDAKPSDSSALNGAAHGLIYEIAEELYVREKTAAELEALAKPPFKRVFDGHSAESLDMEAHRRTRSLIAAASENTSSPTFLPEAVYEENSLPLGTSQALAAELVMLVPVVNIIFAAVISFSKRANKNLRSLARAFLIITGFAVIGAAVFLAGRMF